VGIRFGMDRTDSGDGDGGGDGRFGCSEDRYRNSSDSGMDSGGFSRNNNYKCLHSKYGGVGSGIHSSEGKDHRNDSGSMVIRFSMDRASGGDGSSGGDGWSAGSKDCYRNGSNEGVGCGSFSGNSNYKRIRRKYGGVEGGVSCGEGTDNRNDSGGSGGVCREGGIENHHSGIDGCSVDVAVSDDGGSACFNGGNGGDKGIGDSAESCED